MARRIPFAFFVEKGTLLSFSVKWTCQRSSSRYSRRNMLGGVVIGVACVAAHQGFCCQGCARLIFYKVLPDHGVHRGAPSNAGQIALNGSQAQAKQVGLSSALCPKQTWSGLWPQNCKKLSTVARLGSQYPCLLLLSRAVVPLQLDFLLSSLTVVAR